MDSPESTPTFGWGKKALTGFFAFLMIGGAIGHVASPDFYAPLVPPPIPLWFANVASTVVEGTIGIMLIVPRTRALGIAMFCALMVAFMPIHIWDLTKDQPAVGSTTAAIIRIVVQVVFIVASAWLARVAFAVQRAEG